MVKTATGVLGGGGGGKDDVAQGGGQDVTRVGDALDAVVAAVLAPFGVRELEVQAMAPAGQACMLTALEDPLLGPVVSFGIAGDATDLLGDWVHRVPPLTDRAWCW